jgi:hypothetical protein
VRGASAPRARGVVASPECCDLTADATSFGCLPLLLLFVDNSEI